MRIDLDVAQHQLTWQEIQRRARYAEEMGYDGAWVFDHFKALYGDPLGPCLEGWTLLAALATTTSRIRLGALVTGVTYRSPVLLAAEAVTVDHLSNGRLDFGIGAAWNEEEHREFGFPFPPARERIGRVDEAVQVARLLMTRDHVSFDGRYYQLQHATYRPRPVQQPHPPFWIGGGGERYTLPVVGQQADVWHSAGSIESLIRKSRIVDEHARAAGRDPASIMRSTDLSLSEPLDQVQKRAEQARAAGFTSLMVSWPREGWDRVVEFTRSLFPALQAL